MVHSQAADDKITILLVDENRIFADVIAMRLREQAQVDVVAVAGSVAEARKLLVDLRVDLLLVDYQCYDELTHHLATAHPATRDGHSRVLVLSGLRDTRAIFDALESGARGWVAKDSTFESVWRAVQEVMDGRMVLSPSVVEPVVMRMLDAVRQQKPPPERADFVANLSPRELEVLRLLVAGLSKREIAARLFLSVNTVRTHVQHLLRHADEHTTLALVAAARELGVTGLDEAR